MWCQIDQDLVFSVKLSSLTIRKKGTNNVHIEDNNLLCPHPCTCFFTNNLFTLHINSHGGPFWEVPPFKEAQPASGPNPPLANVVNQEYIEEQAGTSCAYAAKLIRIDTG